MRGNWYHHAGHLRTACVNKRAHVQSEIDRILHDPDWKKEAMDDLRELGGGALERYMPRLEDDHVVEVVRHVQTLLDSTPLPKRCSLEKLKSVYNRLMSASTYLRVLVHPSHIVNATRAKTNFPAVSKAAAKKISNVLRKGHLDGRLVAPSNYWKNNRDRCQKFSEDMSERMHRLHADGVMLEAAARARHRLVKCDGRIYESLQEAHRETGYSVVTIKARIARGERGYEFIERVDPRKQRNGGPGRASRGIGHSVVKDNVVYASKNMLKRAERCGTKKINGWLKDGTVRPATPDEIAALV